tara:strand:+ start:742 stop:1470 length:729 start_codon:yes stop_codon:yes gene_type:complete
LSVLEPIWKTKTETASRVRQRIEVVLTWATVSKYRSGDNPARWAGNLKELLPTPSKIKIRGHHKALPWQDVPASIVDLENKEGTGARALEFLIGTAARSGEVRYATWDEINFETALWTIPSARMKARKTHRVPLTNNMIKLLKALPRQSNSNFIFTAPRGGALSDMSIAAVCKLAGIDATPNGFRSSFKDWARNCTRYSDEVSELALAHVSSDATRAAYTRDELLDLRRHLMNDWQAFQLKQ